MRHYVLLLLSMMSGLSKGREVQFVGEPVVCDVVESCLPSKIVRLPSIVKEDNEIIMQRLGDIKRDNDVLLQTVRSQGNKQIELEGELTRLKTEGQITANSANANTKRFWNDRTNQVITYSVFFVTASTLAYLIVKNERRFTEVQEKCASEIEEAKIISAQAEKAYLGLLTTVKKYANLPKNQQENGWNQLDLHCGLRDFVDNGEAFFSREEGGRSLNKSADADEGEHKSEYPQV